MQFFKNQKGKKNNKERFPGENYSILKAEIDGKLALFTINIAYKNYSFKKDYPFFLYVTVETVNQNDNGHPTDEEAGIFNELESDLKKLITSTDESHYIGRSALNGYREIFFYIKDPKKTGSILKNHMKENPNPRILEIQIEEDPEWKCVAMFLK
jgi:hypothetical protein